MALLAAQLQPIIDEMRAEGINKIILQAHLQNISNEKLLATLLKGVDIILAAGSNTRLGDADDVAVAFPGHAADFADTYPLRVTDAEGGTTLIVNTDNEYTYLGRLKVDFDAQGRIIVGNLDADAAINGAYASTAENVAAAWGTTTGNLATTAFADGTKGDAVEKLTDAGGAVIAAKDGNVFGFTNVYLEGERAFVRSQETNLGSLSATPTPSRCARRPGSAWTTWWCPSRTAAASAPDRHALAAAAGRHGGQAAAAGETRPPARWRAAFRSSTSRTRCASTTS
jgi:2',3'-cyclic-nucleotide 2'-phosphodiesterase (5'-nucleotidase family)